MMRHQMALHVSLSALPIALRIYVTTKSESTVSALIHGIQTPRAMPSVINAVYSP